MVKIIVLGDSGCGKTSLFIRLIHNTFSLYTKATVGIDYGYLRFPLEEATVQLEIWDSAGQERFYKIAPTYCRGSRGALVVYDATQSHLSTLRWKKTLDDCCGIQLPVLLVAAKCDMLDKDQDRAELDKFSEQNGFIGWVATSSMTNIGVQQTMRMLLGHMGDSLSFSDTHEDLLQDPEAVINKSVELTAPTVIDIEHALQLKSAEIRMYILVHKSYSEFIMTINKQVLNMGQNVEILYHRKPINRVVIRDRRGHALLLELNDAYELVTKLQAFEKKKGVTLNIQPISVEDQFVNFMAIFLKASAQSGFGFPLISQQMNGAATFSHCLLDNLYLQSQHLPSNIAPILAPMPYYSHIFHLDLYNTKLETSSLTILTYISQAKSIRSIKLRRCQLASQHADLIVKFIDDTPSLEVIDIAENQLGDTGISVLLNCIAKSSITDLDFSYNNFWWNICTTLCELISTTVKLRVLALVNDSCIKSGISSIITALLSNASIISIDLGIGNLSPQQQQNIDTILRRNIVYKPLYSIHKLQPGPSNYSLLPITVTDDRSQRIVDQFRQTGKLLLERGIIRPIVSGNTIEQATMVVTKAQIEINYGKQFVVMVPGLQAIQLPTSPVTFGLADKTTNFEFFYFSCESDYVSSLLDILNYLIPSAPLKQEIPQVLHSLTLIEDGTFSRYAATLGEETICLKVFSKRRSSTQSPKVNVPIRLKGIHPSVSFLEGDYSPLLAVASMHPVNSLNKIIPSSKISWDMKLQLLAELAIAMKYLHDNDIVHGTLTPADCLVLSTDPAALIHVCLADFGLGRSIFPSSVFAYDIIQWISPEALNLGIFEKPADVYSFGIILWQMITGKMHPFEDFNYTKGNLAEHILHGGRPEISADTSGDMSPFVALISNCLDGNPEKRPTFASIIDSCILEPNKVCTHTEPDKVLPIPVAGQALQSNSIRDVSQLQPRSAWKFLDNGGTASIYLTEERTELFPVVVKEFVVEIKNKPQFLAHINSVAAIDHPCIVTHYGTCDLERPLIFMEYMSNGDLFKALRDSQKQELIAWSNKGLAIAKNIAAGLKFLHEQAEPMVHSDIKTANILLNDKWEAKICDIDTSRIRHTAFLTMRSSVRHTIQYSAPEVIDNEQQNEKVDIFAFGIILWELLTQKVPWENMGPTQIISAIAKNKRLPIPPETPQSLKEIMQKCWDAEPQERPTAAEIAQVLADLS